MKINFPEKKDTLKYSELKKGDIFSLYNSKEIYLVSDLTIARDLVVDKIITSLKENKSYSYEKTFSQDSYVVLYNNSELTLKRDLE